MVFKIISDIPDEDIPVLHFALKVVSNNKKFSEMKKCPDNISANEDCSFYTPDCPFEPPMTYAKANFIINHELIKRDDKSYNEYIQEHFNGFIKK